MVPAVMSAMVSLFTYPVMALVKAVKVPPVYARVLLSAVTVSVALLMVSVPSTKVGAL